MKKVGIEQVEASIAEELDKPLKAALKRHGYSIHESLRLRLSLLNAEGRKRSNAVAHAWVPEKSELAQFWLEPSAAAETVASDEVVQKTETVPPSTSSPQTLHGLSVMNVEVHPAEVEF
jgi:hypothetical protein